MMRWWIFSSVFACFAVDIAVQIEQTGELRYLGEHNKSELMKKKIS